MTKRLIQASITGFEGEPRTVYSLYDLDTGLLVVNKEVAFREDRFGGCVIVSNAELPAREALFTVDHFPEAIEAFFELSRGKQIHIEDKASRSNPTHCIQDDGLSTNGGRTYRINPNTLNCQVAVMATCWYVKRSRTLNKVVNMADRLLEIQRGGILSV
ncbi:hypothetical protein [Cupriavidus basilensis]|uniref:hypothetical protein n=1 Tax=Cupriavidus basilensis TaxID=68895 RepID=UPI0005BD823B|nr:hypothetical protein [Cupriavidus basilensis]